MHALRGDRYKYIRYHGIWDSNELYDLQEDPLETHNLINSPKHAPIVKQMNEKMFDILETPMACRCRSIPTAAESTASGIPMEAKPPNSRTASSRNPNPATSPDCNRVNTTSLARYTCHRTSGPLRIDGRLDEPDWQSAPVSEPFVDIVTGEKAWFDTRVRILWDNECLYFGFTAGRNRRLGDADRTRLENLGRQ